MKYLWLGLKTHPVPDLFFVGLGLATLCVAFSYGPFNVAMAAVIGVMALTVSLLDGAFEAAHRYHRKVFQRAFKAEILLNLIDELRAEEGNVVTLLCPNPDFEGPAQIVEVTAEWTAWEAMRFPGETLEDALTTAAGHRMAWQRQQEVLNSNQKEIELDDE